MTIFEQIKELLEIDTDEPIFDKQLLLYLNACIGYLKNNKIPLTEVDKNTTAEDWHNIGLIEGDEAIVIDYLHLYTFQRFDRSLMSGNQTTLNWIESQLIDAINHLKAIYDNEIIEAVL